jgi:hypothetical protein
LKVAGAPTKPARKLSIVSSLHYGGLLGLRLPDPGKVDVTKHNLKLSSQQNGRGVRAA